MSASLTRLRRPFGFALLVLAAAGALVAILAGLIVWFGLYDVGATSKHVWPVEWLLHFVMKRSVAHHAPEMQPPDLNDPLRVERGALHYASACASCHGAPGELASPIAQQMTPVPPGLYSATLDFDPSQLFWIVKNGVKMTAMPAWPAQERDDEVWDMVAFLEHLDDLNGQRYAALTGIRAEDEWLPRLTIDGFDPATCARCHGSDGAGRPGLAPALNALSASQFIAALRAYRDGSRPSGFMQPVAAAMSDAQIAAAATYYGALAPQRTAP